MGIEDSTFHSGPCFWSMIYEALKLAMSVSEVES